jgi:CubicO group peptidase (beta-lactamase class C family)
VNKFLVILLVICSPAWADWDRNFTPNGGVTKAYQTGRYTNGPFKNTEFKPSPLARSLVKQYQSNIKQTADQVFEYDDYTLGMIMLDQGKVVYQRYNDTDDTTEFNSWSIAKSLTNIITGQALCRGDIRNIDDPAYRYVPELRGTAYGDSTIRELLTMTSGAPRPHIYHGESATDNYDITRGFKNQKDLINRSSSSREYRGQWAYDGLNQAALGLVLDSLRGRKYYVQNYLNAAGVANTSHWIVDNNDSIVAAYGYGARLEDWARIVQLSMDMLLGRAIVADQACMREFMLEATRLIVKPTELGRPGFFGWGYTWVHPTVNHGYAMMGHAGQRIYVDPNSQRILIVFRHQKNDEFDINMGNKLYGPWRLGQFDTR